MAGIEATRVKSAAPIRIVGIAELGSLAIQCAKALGHLVFTVDNREEGSALAQEIPLKSDLVVRFNGKDAAKMIKEWSGDGGLTAIMITADDNDTTNWMLSTLRPHGVAVPLGLALSHAQFDSFARVFQELNIVGSVVFTKEQATEKMKGRSVVTGSGVFQPT